MTDQLRMKPYLTDYNLPLFIGKDLVLTSTAHSKTVWHFENHQNCL